MLSKTNASPQSTQDEKPSAYSFYVLAVLTLVYVFNFVDRQILSILAPDIKAQLGISDAQMGFLYGTAFAIFYAIFGIPLGKLADVWVRKKLIAIGLGVWSLMTALSGTARSFMSLSLYRIGVCIGEASASPAAYSMLIDRFPRAFRATALSIYSSGVFIGSGIALFIGGGIVERWNGKFLQANGVLQAPFDLAGWQVAFLAVGIPGLLLAVWVASLREPIRGARDGLISENHPEPFKIFRQELASIVPPFTLLSLIGKPNAKRELGINIVLLLAITILCWFMIHILGANSANIAQWLAIGVGLYASASWAQSLRLRDPVAFALIFKSPSFLLSLFGFAGIAFVSYGVGFWMPSHFIRTFEVDLSEFGLRAGLAVAVGGFIGINLGGFLSDRLIRHTNKARLIISFFSALLSFPVILWMLELDNLDTVYWSIFIFYVVSTMYVGCAPTFVNEFVLPRMRSLGSAVYLLVLTIFGLAMGPYTAGVLSDGLQAGYGNLALKQSLYYCSYSLLLALVLLGLAMFFINQDERNRVIRARALGEQI